MDFRLQKEKEEGKSLAGEKRLFKSPFGPISIQGDFFSFFLSQRPLFQASGEEGKGKEDGGYI